MHTNSSTFTFMIGVPCGSINEKKSQSGISHMLEHMLFKSSTSSKSIEVIRNMFDLGAKYNAYTSKDYTMFFIQCSNKYAVKAYDMLIAIVTRFNISKAEFEKEKRVVFEELALTHNDLHNIFNILHIGTAYSSSIIGNHDTLSNITYEEIKKYYDEHYQNPSYMIICDKVTYEKVNKYHHVRSNKTHCKPKYIDFNLNRELGTPKYCITHKPGQDNIEGGVLAFLTYPASDHRRWCCDLAAYILHYSLFLELREKRGLVYTVNVVNVIYLHTGYLRISFKTQQATCDKILSIIKKEKRKMQLLSVNEYLEHWKNFQAYQHKNTHDNPEKFFEKHFCDFLYGVDREDIAVDIKEFKRVCKAIFKKTRLAFKFSTKISMLKCLENLF